MQLPQESSTIWWILFGTCGETCKVTVMLVNVKKWGFLHVFVPLMKQNLDSLDAFEYGTYWSHVIPSCLNFQSSMNS